MTLPPLARQFLVAGSTHLAALSAGGVIAYPSVLLEQLKSNDTIIQIDLHKGSWIGSVHGIAGLPSIFLPLIMQHRGRRFAFILSCLFIITGWIVTYLSQSIATLIIGECFHGLGTNSLVTTTFLSITEMVSPVYRNTCLLLYGAVQAFGISSAGILGRYLHWKTIGIIMSCPVFIALLIGFAWPESPSWLAYRRRFGECEQCFVKLRGTDEEAKKELKALLNTKTEDVTRPGLQTLKKSVVSRDFYVPAFHTCILLNVLYWCGGMPVIIYGTDMITKISGTMNAKAKLFMDIAFFIGYMIASILVRYFSSKKVMLFSLSGTTICMAGATIFSFFSASLKIDFALYCLMAFQVFLSLGSSCIGFSLSSEIMPVKYRGIGGSLYVVLICILHSSCLKAYPYLCLFLNIWGVFLIYAIYGVFSIVFIWKCIPDTKNRTLKEIEDYYASGRFKDGRDRDGDETVNKPMIKCDGN
ncbi:facilitated trehalose transporter Tret1-like [Spodoptera litura]|uniref:Facilitated trehalose transporter Tret1-like n=1 Tax=Spodoptera litura TaxID=69820 RepID=A0A9J7J693_SPOLT|nr:facilitated trehalose transporter Tret1-like [Spodoptera litura]